MSWVDIPGPAPGPSVVPFPERFEKSRNEDEAAGASERRQGMRFIEHLRQRPGSGQAPDRDEIDRAQTATQSQGMPDPVTREELTARLEAIDARQDARFAEMRATLARLPSRGELWGGMATMLALVFAFLAVFVAVMAWRQDQFIAIGERASQPATAPTPAIIINVPGQPAAPPPVGPTPSGNSPARQTP